MFFVYQVDSNLFLRFQEDLKFQADEASNTGSLFYNLTLFGEGVKVFDTATANTKIHDLIRLNMYLDSDLKPIANNYWTDSLTYYVYYFDHSNTIKTYRNGALQSQLPFTFNYMFTEPLTGYQKLITEPTVIVTIDAGKPKFRLSFLNPSNVIRTSAYEYSN